jgi:hypothetical protein
MSSKKTKGVQLSLEQALAQRLAFVRRFKHRIPDLNERLEKAVLKVVAESESKAGVTEESWKESKPCPICSHGVLFPKKSKKSPGLPPFMGCSRFPKCRHSEPVKR